jgi:hypothetical protein
MSGGGRGTRMRGGGRGTRMSGGGRGTRMRGGGRGTRMSCGGRGTRMRGGGRGTRMSCGGRGTRMRGGGRVARMSCKTCITDTHCRTERSGLNLFVFNNTCNLKLLYTISQRYQLGCSPDQTITGNSSNKFLHLFHVCFIIPWFDIQQNA